MEHKLHPPFAIPSAAPGTMPGTLRVNPQAGPPRIEVIGYGPDEFVREELPDVNALETYMDRWPVLWVNVDGLGHEPTLRSIAQRFDLHRLAMEDVTHVPQRPKVEPYDETLFMVTHMHYIEDGRLRSEQMSLFLRPGVVVTFQEHRGDCLNPVRERIERSLGRIRSAGADYLAYALLDAVIDYGFPLLERINERLEGLEDEVLRNDDPQLLSRIHAIKRELLSMRRSAWPQRDAMGWLAREEIPVVAPETRLYLRDCYDHLSRIIDSIETCRELASDLLNIYLSSLSNRMNAVMKVLTIIATIFIPLTFIAGIYGMNFKYMPELEHPLAYPLVLGVMFLIALVMLLWFRRKRWI